MIHIPPLGWKKAPVTLRYLVRVPSQRDTHTHARTQMGSAPRRDFEGFVSKSCTKAAMPIQPPSLSSCLSGPPYNSRSFLYVLGAHAKIKPCAALPDFAADVQQTCHQCWDGLESAERARTHTHTHTQSTCVIFPNFGHLQNRTPQNPEKCE